MNFKSQFLQELKWRGFIAQMTHQKELDELMSREKIAAYIGFDCTATSLHVGSLIQIMILRLLQKHNHRTIILLGGGTTRIGDPSGKDEARQILSEDKIQQNLQGIKNTLAKFISFENNTAILVNNDDWLKNLNYIEFLRDIGRHFSVNRMLTFESVKTRLERDQPLSFLEFNYMILQAYDFYILNKDLNCHLQIGGSDQWGNIVNGIELIRRVHPEQQAFGLTSPLLTTSDGKKMGKTADGAVWLDDTIFSPFDYFQYFRNTTDADTIKFLKLFTDLSHEEISQFENLQGQEINKAKEILAYETTKICHGEKAAFEALNKAREIFISKNNSAFTEIIITLNGEKKLVEIMKEINACASNGEARRLIEGHGIKINDEVVVDINFTINAACEFDLQIGKKKFFRIIIQ
ncbi:MAG TPA: tyrosine--tRNA ligase [Rickettsiales bacterium]|nr:tyrosine--tRNA ligase [Rickettsiales bacterium]